MNLTITIKINTDNAAFEDDRCGYEVARIMKVALAKIAPDIDDLPSAKPDEEYWLHDINGNPVGTVEIKGVKS